MFRGFFMNNLQPNLPCLFLKHICLWCRRTKITFLTKRHKNCFPTRMGLNLNRDSINCIKYVKAQSWDSKSTETDKLETLMIDSVEKIVEGVIYFVGELFLCDVKRLSLPVTPRQHPPTRRSRKRREARHECETIWYSRFKAQESTFVFPNNFTR